ncbi:hypothetical protein ABZ330_28380 [Streptomyces sp. NPDC006172]|uniref:hypothetical protein n=1 Tax=Streptomyces sp. NPDC006172 TaxID=3154470 RepID=UPI0033C75C13
MGKVCAGVVGKSPEDDSGSGSSISDEELRAFLEESERGANASVRKEPSARARMVTERLRQQDARGEAPAGWRTGPVAGERRADRKRRTWAFVGVPVAIALAVVAMRPSLLPGDPFGAGPEALSASPLPAETSVPTAAPDEVDPDRPTVDRPFAGSPALAWADGEAGIVLPPAKAVGTWSKAQVEQALRQTRKLLVDANLDPVTLRGGRPETALDVIEPQQKDLHARLNAALNRPDKEHDPLTLFSRFDPRELRLAGDVVKTRGRMTFTAGEDASVAVHADYTFVYPLARAEKGATEVSRAIVRRVLDVRLPDPAKYRATPGKISVRNYQLDIGNSACDVYDGFLHPNFSTSGPTEPAPTGPTVDPYDRSKDIDADRGKGCGVVSRS